MSYHKSSRRNSVAGVVIAVVCIAVYICALVNAAIRLYVSAEQRLVDADYEFSALADRVSATGVVQSFADETFQEIIQKSLNESKTLEGIIITGPHGEFAFEKEPGKAIRIVNGMPRFKNRFDFSKQPFFQPLQIQGLRNVTIQAVASAIDYAMFAKVLKQTLLLIVIALSLAFFTLIIESLLKGQLKTSGYNDRRDKGEKAGKPDHERPQPERPQAASAGIGSGVPGYSQRGRVVREENTSIRLTEELSRCAYAGRDLSFITMEFKPHADDSFYARFAADVARFFSSRDFVCESGEKGISVICPGLNLDAGFLNAGEFHSRVTGKYPEFFKTKTDLCMGLSACAGRPVNAERLMFEAEEALERAMMDPVSHIVAFKSDPEKFRAFMETQDQNE